jgi:hypothetical protein
VPTRDSFDGQAAERNQCKLRSIKRGRTVTSGGQGRLLTFIVECSEWTKRFHKGVGGVHLPNGAISVSPHDVACGRDQGACRRLGDLARGQGHLPHSAPDRPPDADPFRPVAAGEDVLPPGTVGEVPCHGLFEARFKGLERAPAELPLEFRRVDRVSAVMAGPVGDEADRLPARSPRRGIHGVEEVADRMYDVEVGALVAAAYIVGLADHAALEDECEGVRVILDIEPVTHVHAVAVHGKRLVRQALDDHVRDQLLREVIGPVIVGAVRHHGRKIVGLVPRPHEVIGRCLARGIGRVRRIGRAFGEQALRPERAVDFVGRHVQQTEAGAARRGEASPIAQRLLQQDEGTDDVGLDEFARTVDRTIDMAFGGQVHHEIGLVAIEQRANASAVADVDLGEGVARMSRALRNRGEVRGVGELVDVHDIRPGAIEEISHDGRTDEAGPSRYEDGLAVEPHRCCSPLIGKRLVYGHQVFAVAALGVALGERVKLLARDVAEPQRDFLETCNPQALSLLENLYEVARFDERSMRSGVEPGEAAPENLDEQVAALEIGAVDVGDLEFATAGRLDRCGDVDDVVVVEIEAGHGEV